MLTIERFPNLDYTNKSELFFVALIFPDPGGIMREEQKKILKGFAETVRKVYPDARIWAFGSYARDMATGESDLDICVVIPGLRPDDRLAISDIAWEVGFNHDLHLSTIVRR